MDDGIQESRWVLRAQVGSREALECLLKVVQEPLYRYIVGLVCNPSLAEDILQEVLLLIYQKLRWLRDPELFRPWCFRIASRQAFRRLKRERRWTGLHGQESLEGIESNEETTPDDPELLAKLPELFDQVSPASRAVVVLHYQNHLSLDEVAAVLGIPFGTAKSRLSYGLSVLRRLVRRENGPDRREVDVGQSNRPPSI
jgi:RNA polymerase sigma-70 factor (ECF subfamily)